MIQCEDSGREPYYDGLILEVVMDCGFHDELLDQCLGEVSAHSHQERIP